MGKIIKGYKAFNKGMKCRDKQYAENTTFEENESTLCKKGMHFCEKPLDVLNYYPLVNEKGEISEFAEVEAPQNLCDIGDSKICTKKLKIKSKISFSKLVELAIDFDYMKIINDSDNNNTNNSAQIGSSGDYAQIGSSGDSAKIGSSGDSAKIGSSGDYAQIGSSGYSAKIGSSGDSAQIGSSGDYAQIGSSGDSAKIGSSGDSAKIGSSGDYAKIGSSGDYAKIDLSGDHSVGMACGINSKIKGKIGNFISLAEWEYDEEKENYIPIYVKSARIDGEILKEDTYYTLKNGEFVEVIDE